MTQTQALSFWGSAGWWGRQMGHLKQEGWTEIQTVVREKRRVGTGSQSRCPRVAGQGVWGEHQGKEKLQRDEVCAGNMSLTQAC